ncbi:MAG: N-acetylneuraminate synthase family protein [Treponema sp.]|nr:N-acetylneuraminate synthase family protein [Treponema sp.]
MIIAEIGTAHGGSIDKAKELIKAAYDAGVDAVKFQWVYADEILHPDTGFVLLPGGQTRLYDRFKKLEVEKDFFVKAQDYAHSLGVKFVCSPFGVRSLKELLSINPDVVKVASPELNHYPMLREIKEAIANGLKTPILISSGVSKLSDIEKALECLDFSPEKENSSQFTLLHCITSYPAPESEYNLRLVQTLHDIFGIQTGISDHSLDPVLVPVLTTALGGITIEKHITLSKKTDGLDDPVALEPEQFANLVYSVHQTQAVLKRYGKEEGLKITIKQMEELFGKEKVSSVLGNGIKHLAKSESANYGRTNRSIHFMHDMKKGEKIEAKDLSILRTEKILSPGISPEYIDDVTGAILSQDIKAGSGLQWENLLFR